jgi:RecA-family ATPase
MNEQAPAALPVVAENIPQELKALRQWVVWAWWHDGSKWTKPLLQAERVVWYDERAKDIKLGWASHSNPATWTTFDKAYGAYRDSKGRLDGIGFVFAEDDPYTGVDLDKCRNLETGQLEPWAWKDIRELASYAELSPSGRGVKVFLKAKLPGEGKKFGGREIYDRKRYFTMTGHHLDSTPRGIEARQHQAEAFYSNKAYFPAKPAGERASIRAASTCNAEDAEVIERVKAHESGGKLWAGSLEDHGGDHSRADLALCGLLAFYCGPDEERIDRLFRESGLYRGKWERDDYRERTIGLALDDRTEFYQWPCMSDAECRELFEAGPGLLFDDMEAPEPASVPLQTATVPVQAAAAVATAAPVVDAGEQARREAAAFDQAEGKKPHRRRGLSLAELDNLPDLAWHIDRHFPTNGLVAIVGPSGVGKSFVALDYALCIATGRPYLGTYDVQAGPVLYIASEGAAGLKKRVRAWMKHYGLTELPANMVVVPYAFDMLSPDEQKPLAVIINEDLRAYPSFVVVDTLARNFGAGNDNSSQDMGKFVAMCDWLREGCKCTAAVVHHTGKDETKKERGSTALRGACDTLLLLEEADGGKGVLVRCDKQKDAEPFESYILRKQKVSLSDEVDSLVLVGQGQAATRYQLLPKELKEFIQRLFDAFKMEPFTAVQAVNAKTAPKSTVYKFLPRLVEKQLVRKDMELYRLPDSTVHMIRF